MHDTTSTAGPLSYSQSCDTFRPRRAVLRTARRTGLGRTAFVHFLKRGSVRNRFVAELVPEGRPGCVVDALRHLGFGEFQSRHVADRDVIEAPDELERKLVLEVGAGIRHLGMQLGNMPLVLSRTLRLRQSFGGMPAKPVIGELLAGRKRREVLQTKIDADASLNRACRHISNFYHDVEKPVPARILRKVAAVPDLAFGQQATIENAEGMPGKAKRLALSFQIAALHGHPSKALPTAVSQVRTAMLAARFRVLLACRVDRTGMDAEFLAAARGQHVQIEPARPRLPPFERVLLRVIAEVPDVVHRAALLVEQAVERLHPVAVDTNHAAHSNVGMPPFGGAPFTPRLEWRGFSEQI